MRTEDYLMCFGVTATVRIGDSIPSTKRLRVSYDLKRAESVEVEGLFEKSLISFNFVVDGMRNLQYSSLLIMYDRKDCSAAFMQKNFVVFKDLF